MRGIVRWVLHWLEIPYVTPAKRVYEVVSESRIFVIDVEVRTYGVQSEDRTFVVPG